MACENEQNAVQLTWQTFESKVADENAAEENVAAKEAELAAANDDLAVKKSATDAAMNAYIKAVEAHAACVRNA